MRITMKAASLGTHMVEYRNMQQGVTAQISLRCPETGLLLRQIALDDAERVAGPLHAREASQVEATEMVMLRSDDRAAYPIVDGVPILMMPEMLATNRRVFDMRDPRWAEAYDEMEFYNQEAVKFAGAMQSSVDELEKLAGVEPLTGEWIDNVYDSCSQLDALQHMGDLSGKTVLVLGGKGSHAVRFLIAGAAEAWLVSPMHYEAMYARELGHRMGVGDRLHTVVGVAEQLPFGPETFDAVFTSGCLHHMTTAYAGPEIMRVLLAGGRFAAVEPWQTFLHKWGTRLIGKREANAYCSPLTSDRLVPMRAAFGELDLRHHGPVLRYLALAMQKMTKRKIKPATGLRMMRIDDMIPLPARYGGSLAVLATKT